MNDGGPAFATVTTIRKEADPDFDHSYFTPGVVYFIPQVDVIRTTGGMSLRDYFAAAAAEGMLEMPNPFSTDQSYPADVARAAYLVADAMLAERSKP